MPVSEFFTRCDLVFSFCTAPNATVAAAATATAACISDPLRVVLPALCAPDDGGAAYRAECIAAACVVVVAVAMRVPRIPAISADVF